MAKKKRTSGRKRIDPKEKMILVGFYTKKKYVDIIGGMDEARERAKIAVEVLAYERTVQYP